MKTEPLAPVEFTQLLFPDAKRRKQIIDRPIEIAKTAEYLKIHGICLEIENKNDFIWMSARNIKTEEAVDRFCMNGPEVPEMVDQLILAALLRWKDTL